MEHTPESTPQALELEEGLIPEERQQQDLPPIEFVSPGLFSIHKNLAQPAPGRIKTARHSQRSNTFSQRFNEQNSAIQHLLLLLQQTRHTLCLLSEELEPWLYAHHAIQRACQDFLLRNRRCQMRILIRDSSRIVQDGHPLLELAHRLPSHCTIRKINPERSSPKEGFLIADKRALLVYPEAYQAIGHVFYDDPGRSRQYQAQFDAAWDYSVFDSNLRSMPL